MRTKKEQMTQFIENLVDRAADTYNERQKKLLEMVGDRPYGARRLSHEEELQVYRDEQRNDPQFWKEFIDEERNRLGLDSKMADGRPLIPKSVISEMLRLEARHRGREED